MMLRAWALQPDCLDSHHRSAGMILGHLLRLSVLASSTVK